MNATPIPGTALLAAAVTAGFCLAGAPGAQASSVSVEERDISLQGSRGQFATFRLRVVVYDSDPGERNVLTMSFRGEDVAVTDSGATIRPGPGCTAGSGGAVTCRGAPPNASTPPVLGYAYVANTGDGGDRISLSGGIRGVAADAGAGDDVLELLGEIGPVQPSGLSGGAGADRITGAGLGLLLDGGPDADLIIAGGGAERLRGGPGADRLDAGAGNDVLEDADVVPGAPDPPIGDVHDGGPGVDLLSYAGRIRPVDVDLEARSLGGEAGEQDSLVALEGIEGGSAGDVLRGDAQANSLQGGPGDDTLLGRAGADTLVGGTGANRLLGGEGDDLLQLDGGGRDAIACDGGSDLARNPNALDNVPRDCEAIPLVLPRPFNLFESETEVARVTTAVRFRRGRAYVRLRCPFAPGPDDGDPAACTGRLTVRTTSGRRLGAVRFTRVRSRDTVLQPRLSFAPRVARFSLSLRTRLSGGGGAFAVNWTARLR